jgi:hypothetical protein
MAGWVGGARRLAAWTSESAWRANLLATLIGLILFGAVCATSGRLTANDGLGWDGRQYAHMVTDRLVDGNVPTQTRPLIPLVTRVPYRAGLPIITAFQAMNLLDALVLYLLTCAVLDHYQVGALAKIFFVAHLALSIATGRMFGFYPVQIDLGVLAILMLATWLVLSRGGLLAGAMVIVAVTAREFAVALAVLFLVRSIRKRRDVVVASIAAVLAVAVLFAIRTWAVTTNLGDPDSPLQNSTRLLGNLDLWRDPAFVTFFIYFGLTLLGGATCLLATHAAWCANVLLRRPELGAYSILIVGAAALGNADIWRYLVFLLPVVVILFGRFARQYRPSAAILAGALVITVVTQQPFTRMTLDTYFRDWFPFYRVHDSDIDIAAFWVVWRWRLVVTSAALVVLTLAQWLGRRKQQLGGTSVPQLAG